ncbi:TetR/AcrR family transcriptional regulator [Deinococcus hopiensis]|uniref:TetR/AcrR family transcriptional regulator n=1 Tax=Deinococcus hopiensis TaxID=309885 RepID=UPI001FE48BA9|nr:TetR/AcrR family transcriptional regulator [Deinococcus hopiensis]
MIRNRTVILDTAQRHFQRYGIGTSLDAIAKEAGIGPGTLYRHFPTREALLASVLQLHSQELVARRATLIQIAAPDEALQQWLSALEDYLNAFNGLPEPLMAAARASAPDSPLTYPCDQLIAMTDEFLRGAQHAGQVRAEVQSRDLFLAIAAVAWIRGEGSTDDGALKRLRHLIQNGYQRSATTESQP